jgi:putative hydrolase of the HAD superfamily
MNIIFDFGNVLFDLDLPAFEREMKRYAGENTYETAKAQLLQERVFELYETGGMSTEEFVGKISGASGVSPEQVVSAWNSIFILFPRHRLNMLLDLRKQHKVFLLSNINPLHEAWIADYMEHEYGLRDYESLHFDGVYFSHLIRLRKPTREIYEYVLADAELKPEESVFFDDLPENVEAASALGIQGVWHDPKTEIVERLKQMKLWDGD